MINRALLEMVVAENGPTTWAEVSRQAGVEGIVFLRNQFHPDALTFRIAHVACARLGEEPAAFLARFGRFFVRVADRLNYGDLFDLIGTTLPDFVRNLPNFHDRNALVEARYGRHGAPGSGLALRRSCRHRLPLRASPRRTH